MKYDLVLCGVGGQGILSVAAVIAQAAMDEGLSVRQSEVHGMAQRGGAVQAHLRIADREIHGSLIGRGRADMLLSMEPLETLRYMEFLTAEARVITALEPFKNIPNYPDIKLLRETLKNVSRLLALPVEDMAKEAGHIRSANMVLVGAASVWLPIGKETLREAVAKRLGSKGKNMLELNLRAFDLGRSGAEK